MTEMVERVAKALGKNDRNRDIGGMLTQERWDRYIEDGGWKIYEAEARAAIEAMREPTEAMKFAPPDVDFGLEDAAFAWKCMIDAALAEAKKER